jgi:heme/copper-type cytochrome/quinol oxidase subunit 2
MRLLVLLALVLLAPSFARADDLPEQHLALKDHVFVPQQLTVPANQKIKIIVKNEDSSAAEFESAELNREKVVPANGEITVYIDPLDPGTYGFFDDFHRDTTTGTIVAK